MFCPECGKALEEGIVFCPNCGAKVGETFGAMTPTIKPASKPMGIIFTTILTAILGFGVLILGVFLLGLSQVVSGITEEIMSDWRGLFEREITEADGSVFGFNLAGYLLSFLGISSLTASYGLFTLAEWGRKLALVLYFIFILLSFLSVIFGHPTLGLILSRLIWIAVLIRIIIYLFQPDVRRLFQ